MEGLKPLNMCLMPVLLPSKGEGGGGGGLGWGRISFGANIKLFLLSCAIVWHEVHHLLGSKLCEDFFILRLLLTVKWCSGSKKLLSLILYCP